MGPGLASWDQSRLPADRRDTARTLDGHGARLAGMLCFTCEAHLPQVDVDHTKALAARLSSGGQSQLAVIGESRFSPGSRQI